jgi:hypothetical protein
VFRAARLSADGEYRTHLLLVPEERGDGLVHVRPGGLAVHVFDYVEDVEAEQESSLNRHDIERIAALALSHANDVARLRFLHGAPSPDGRAPLPFGLAVLRGGAVD